MRNLKAVPLPDHYEKTQKVLNGREAFRVNCLYCAAASILNWRLQAVRRYT